MHTLTRTGLTARIALNVILFNSVLISAGLGQQEGENQDPPAALPVLAPAPALPPQDVEATSLSKSSVRLTWKNPEDSATAIEVEWRIAADGAEVSSKRSIGATEEQLTVAKLQRSTEYQFRLRRIAEEGPSSWTEPVKIRTLTGNRLEEVVDGVWNWLAGLAWWGWVFLVMGILFAGSLLIQLFQATKRETRVYASYILASAVVYLTIGGSDLRVLYCWTFVLGMATAFAEIIQKFSDNPLAALGTWAALVYHILNGAIAAFALYILIHMGILDADPLSRVKAVVAAGVGSMFVLRSKLFSIKIDDKTIAVGPEQLITTYLNFMETIIDRKRAAARIDLVTKTMDNLNFDKVFDYTMTMLHASQLTLKNPTEGEALVKDLRDKLLTNEEKAKRETKMGQQHAAYWLGFRLQRAMGREFLEKIFSEELKRGKGQEWWIDQISEIEDEETGLLSKIFKVKKADFSQVGIGTVGPEQVTKAAKAVAAAEAAAEEAEAEVTAKAIAAAAEAAVADAADAKAVAEEAAAAEAKTKPAAAKRKTTKKKSAKKKSAKTHTGTAEGE